MSSGFIRKVYSELKEWGVDTTNMPPNNAIPLWKRMQSRNSEVLSRDESIGQKGIDEKKFTEYNIHKKGYAKDLTVFVDKFSKSEIEHALIIFANGEKSRCIGDATSVLNYDISNLKGAIVVHNHSPQKSENSFSKEDIFFFVDNELDELYGIDDKYIYVLSRTNLDIDEDPTVEECMASNGEYVRHIDVIDKVRALGLGYRRYKR